MQDRIIFLSHIHEERELALLLQGKLEEEFSGFVDIFVSSDDQSIPSGTNFLNHIVDSLCKCHAGIYLISERSVLMNWINFELGALWIRSALQRIGNIEIPVIPFCHSGATCSTLPLPIGSLNAINATDAIHLEKAFKTLQSAMGGRGNLKTDFNALAQDVLRIENKYTIGAALKRLIALINCLVNCDKEKLIDYCQTLPHDKVFPIRIKKPVKSDIIEEMKSLENGKLKGFIKVSSKGQGMQIVNDLSFNGAAEVTIQIRADLVMENKDSL